VSYPLLLDEMLADDIADQLRKRDHDVVAVVADTGLVGLPDVRSWRMPPPRVVPWSRPTSRTSGRWTPSTKRPAGNTRG
jgi:hypothetical protein